METNEIMTNEDYEMDEVYDLDLIDDSEKSENKGLKTAIGIGVAAGLGFLGYKFIVKPIVKKFKAKKAEEAGEETVEIVDGNVEYEVCDENGNPKASKNWKK